MPTVHSDPWTQYKDFEDYWTLVGNPWRNPWSPPSSVPTSPRDDHFTERLTSALHPGVEEEEEDEEEYREADRLYASRMVRVAEVKQPSEEITSPGDDSLGRPPPVGSS